MDDSAQITAAFYRRLGSSGLKKLTNHSETDAYLRLVEPLLGKKKKIRILDLGCGYGRISIPLAKQGYCVEGMDCASNLIIQAKKTAKKEHLCISFIVGDMRCIPYGDDSFDRVLCLWSCFDDLLSINDQKRTLQETYRVLKPGGIAFFEMRNGERKEFCEYMKRGGKRAGQRIIMEKVEEIPNLSFNHSRKTLELACQKAKISQSNFRVGFKNIMGFRALVLYIYK